VSAPLVSSRLASSKYLADSVKSTDEGALALRLVGVLTYFWAWRAHLSEGRRWLDLALAIPPRATDTSARAGALTGGAILACLQGEYGLAHTLAERGVASWQGLDDRRGLARARSALAWTLVQKGDHASARPLLEESVAWWRELGDALSALAESYMRQGDDAAARGLLEEALDLYRDTAHAADLVWLLFDLRDIAGRLGDERLAQELYLEGLALTQALEDRWERAHTLRHRRGYTYRSQF